MRYEIYLVFIFAILFIFKSILNFISFILIKDLPSSHMKSKSQASSSNPNSIISSPIIPSLSDAGALEARLESLAKQTHLRRRDLKRILRTLVTDSDVLDLLAGLCAEPDEPSPKNSRLSRFEPKLTR